MCEDCGCFIEEQEFIVNDLYNYNVRPQRAYHRLDHFKEVLGQFQSREGKTITLEILHQIKNERSVVNEVTAVDVKKVMRKLKLTKYMENFYYILFTLRNHASLCKIDLQILEFIQVYINFLENRTLKFLEEFGCTFQETFSFH